MECHALAAAMAHVRRDALDETIPNAIEALLERAQHDADPNVVGVGAASRGFIA